MKGFFSVVIALIVAGLAALVVGGGMCFVGIIITDMGSKQSPIIEAIGSLTMFFSLIVACYIFIKVIIAMTQKEYDPNRSPKHHKIRQSKSEQDE